MLVEIESTIENHYFLNIKTIEEFKINLSMYIIFIKNIAQVLIYYSYIKLLIAISLEISFLFLALLIQFFNIFIF